MDGRRRITLYDQMTAGNSTSLADLILSDNVVLTDQKSDDAPAAAAAVAAGGGSCQLSQQSRTLIDILHDDEQHNNNNNNETTSDRKSKKALNFMDKLRLKLTLNSKSNHNTNNNNNDNDDDDDNNYELTQQGNNTHQQQEQQQQNDVVSAEPETAAEVSVAETVVGVSLMDLLEETDVETVASNRMSDADFEVLNNEFDEGEEEGATMVERNCCVCMVRHKGAAFIPCGHTFCRACSREVWVSRGNCPLCNNFILEILDIF